MLPMLCLSFIHYFCIKDSTNSKKKYTAIFNGIFIVVRQPSDQMGKGGGGGQHPHTEIRKGAYNQQKLYAALQINSTDPQDTEVAILGLSSIPKI